MTATRLLSWNIAQRDACWEALLGMDVDVALLQEARPPPVGLLSPSIKVDPGPWRTAGATCDRHWKAAVVGLSNRVGVEWVPTASVSDARADQLAVSRPGTLAAARVVPREGDPFTVVSVYAAWEDSVPPRPGWSWADVSSHRLISDLSLLLPHPSRHRVVVAGDWNILRGYGEYGNTYAAARYATVFDRMDALGLPLVGPDRRAGRQADPWPEELPARSSNVPTFRHSRQTPTTATRQLDFVFASRAMRESVAVRARNVPEEWGPSDHCRVEIEVAKRIVKAARAAAGAPSQARMPVKPASISPKFPGIWGVELRVIV